MTEPKQDKKKNSKYSAILDTSGVETRSERKLGIRANIKNWLDFVGYYRWYPDLFFDLIRPEVGGINLSPDQRIRLRVLSRFKSSYNVEERGGGKTLIELMACIHKCIFYPNSHIRIASSTRENSASVIKEKWSELVQFYPLLENELSKKPSFSINSAEINFKSGSWITNIANAQSSKGLRATSLNIEEANLLNNKLYEDVLRPIPSGARLTCGNASIDSPEEMQRQISFMTTTGYRASYEFTRNCTMLDGMTESTGDCVLGEGWVVPCYYGRGFALSDIVSAAKRTSPITFEQNYKQRWVGSGDAGLVDMEKLLSLQVLEQAEYEGAEDGEYFMAVDVARSQKAGNCQTCVAIARARRVSNNRICAIQIVNLFTVSGTENFTTQAKIVKRTKYQFNAQIVAIDSNGLGRGLADELAKQQTDSDTGEVYPSWQAVNTDLDVENPQNVDKCMFMLLQQGNVNSDIIQKFIDSVSSSKLQLLIPDSHEIVDDEVEYSTEKRLPFIHTKFFIDEVSNLKLNVLPNGKLSVEQVVKTVPKDRFSAVEYVVWYILAYEDFAVVDSDDNLFRYTFVV